MQKLTTTLLKQSLGKMGYTWYGSQPNLVGIRTALGIPNVFNDVLTCSWVQPALPNGLPLKDQQQFLANWLYVGVNGLPIKADGLPGKNTDYALQQVMANAGTERLRAWCITTTPGLVNLRRPASKAGCAVLVPDQYKNVYRLGLHKDKPDHPALVQTGGIVKAFRDNDRDELAEETKTITEGYFGINIHRANSNGITPRIDGWSAGCQVFQKKSDLNELLSICEAYRQSSGNRFTYTLLRERELS